MTSDAAEPHPIRGFFSRHAKIMVGMLAKSTKLLKSLKLLKVFLSMISMVIFSVCESFALGLAMAVALLLLIFLHEMGHVLALKQKGFGLRLPIFIPFLGAVIFGPRMNNRHDEAYVGLGGPLLGTIAAMVFALPYLFNGQRFWLSASLVGVAINLFNMIPISPFDGGRITQATDYRLRYLGYSLLLVFTAMVGEPGMLILWMLVVMDIDRWSRKRKAFAVYAIFWVMLLLTCLNVGHQFMANMLDCLLGGFIAAMHWLGEYIHRLNKRDGGAVEEPDQDTRPELPTKDRCLWFIVWLALLAIQVVLMCGQYRLLKPR
jgi:Zn-dependent protease